MKLEITKPQPTFKPVTVSFTCETQQELDALGGLFNYTVIQDALNEMCDNEPFNVGIASYFKSKGAEIHQSVLKIHEKVKGTFRR